jgi:hypothetical protein
MIDGSGLRVRVRVRVLQHSLEEEENLLNKK